MSKRNLRNILKKITSKFSLQTLLREPLGIWNSKFFIEFQLPFGKLFLRLITDIWISE